MPGVPLTILSLLPPLPPPPQPLQSKLPSPINASCKCPIFPFRSTTAVTITIISTKFPIKVHQHVHIRKISSCSRSFSLCPPPHPPSYTSNPRTQHKLLYFIPQIHMLAHLSRLYLHFLYFLHNLHIFPSLRVRDNPFLQSFSIPQSNSTHPI